MSSTITKILTVFLLLNGLDLTAQISNDSLYKVQEEATAIFMQYKFQQAIPKLESVAATFKERGLWQNYFECKYYLNVSYAIQKRDVQQSIDSMNADLNLALIKMGENSSGVGEMYFGLGWLYDNPLRQKEQGSDYYSKSLEAFKSAYGLNHAKTAKAIANYTLTLISIDRNKEAEEYLQKALKIYNEVYDEDDSEWSRIYNTAFYYYSGLSLHDQALKYAQAQYDLASGGRMQKRLLVTACRNLCMSYFYLQDYEKAEDYALRELRIGEGILSEEQKIGVYNNLGRIYTYLDHDKAVVFTKKGWQGKQLLYGKEHPLTVSSAINYGNLLSGIGRAKEGLEILNSQKELANDPENNLRLKALIGSAFKMNGNYEEAMAQWKVTKTEFYQTEMVNKLQAFYFYGQSAIAAIESGIELGTDESLIIASDIFEETDSLANHFWSNIEYYDNQRTFLNLHTDLYIVGSRLFHQLFEKTNDVFYADKFLYTTEKSKSAISFSTLQLAQKMDQLNIPKEVLLLKVELDQEILRMQNQGDSKSALIKKTNQRDSLHNAIRKEYPSYYEERINTSYVSISELQNRLDAKSAFLIYNNGEHEVGKNSEIFTMLITNDKVKIWKKTTKDFGKMMETYLSDIRNRKDQLRFKDSLYDLLGLSDLAEYSQISRLNIVPSNELFYLPFDLLTDGDGNYLLEKYTVRYLQSASMDALLAQPDPRLVKVSTLLSPDFKTPSNDSQGAIREAGTALTSAKREVDQITEMIGGQNLSGNSKKQIIRQFEQSDLIHLATHAMVNLQSPGRSAIYLSSTEDSVMYAYELYNQRFNADLVTLSACNTGVGKLQNGEGLQSLGKAFLYAGCPNIIMSHWEVNDESTAELMGYLYENLKEGMSKDEALRQAKLTYLKNADPVKAHPYYWAGFTFTGNPEPLEFESDFNQWWLIILPVLVVVFLSRRKKHQS